MILSTLCTDRTLSHFQHNSSAVAWVFVTVHNALTDAFAIRGGCLIIRKTCSLSILCDECGEKHSPSTSNTYFADFQWNSKVISLGCPISPFYFCIGSKYCWICTRPEYAWTICHWVLCIYRSFTHPPLSRTLFYIVISFKTTETNERMILRYT